MTVDKLSEAIGMIDEDIIAAADRSRSEVRRSRKPLWIGMCSTAACAALITAVALTDPAGIISGTDIGVSGDAGGAAQTSEMNTTPTEGNMSGNNCCTNEVDDAALVPDAATDAVGTEDESSGANKYTADADETADIVVDTDGDVISTQAADAGATPDTCEIVEEELEEEICGTCEVVVEEEADVIETMEDVIVETGEFEETIPDAEDAVEEKVEIGEIISVGGILRYDDVELRVQDDTGSPQSYGELQEYLSCYSDGMNFVLYEITEQLSPEAAYALTGDEIYLISSTLYRARIIRDLLSGDTSNIEFLLTSAGTAHEQIEGLPLLSVGERYASMLSDLGTENVNVALPELTFAVYEKYGTEYAYHLRFAKIRFVDENDADIDMGISEDERYVVTSTANNPVHYVKKLLLDELADLLRNDWSSRGYLNITPNHETQ